MAVVEMAGSEPRAVARRVGADVGAGVGHIQALARCISRTRAARNMTSDVVALA
jgi:hypothetical protein